MPEDLILVVVVDGGSVQSVIASQEIPSVRVIVVDYDDISTDHTLYDEPCSITEMDFTEDDDLIAAVMEAL